MREGLGNIDLVCGSMTHLPFRDRSFDLVISISVIHHAIKSNIEITVREIHRVLGQEGLLLANFVSVEDHRFGEGKKVEEGTFRIREEFEGHAIEELHHFFTEEEIFELLAGFAEVKTEPIRQHRYWKVTVIK
ncbi:MAG: class I SAM-dependent methyltransferase [Thermoproteota archaeon]